MSPEVFHQRILMPGLETLFAVCGVRVSQPAALFLLAVILQESQCEARYQRVSSPAKPGPARGFAQFEKGGGVVGVMTHPSSAAKAQALCQWYGVEFDKDCIWRTLEGHDGLAVGFARLLLLTDPVPIPTTEKEAWACYKDRLWKPGKPHLEAWPGNWKTASDIVYTSGVGS